ncbi:MAG: hypothetical protein NTZ49_05620 [Candidatus Parcubacteria bacterium]|nr:hypothetical protein [Candidatus Parcubacteria bacterium]
MTILLGALLFLALGAVLGFWGNTLLHPPLEKKWMSFSDSYLSDLTFKYPANWAPYGFSSFAEAGVDREKSRVMEVGKITLGENQTLQQYFDQKLDECKKTTPIDPDFGQAYCNYEYGIEINKLKAMNVNGRTAYRTGVEVIPESSGESLDTIYIQSNGGYYVFSITGIGITQSNILDKVLPTIIIK